MGSTVILPDKKMYLNLFKRDEKIATLLTFAIVYGFATQAQNIAPDDAATALNRLKQIQTDLSKTPVGTGDAKIKQIDKMLALGVWGKAQQLINAAPQTSPYKLLKADYLILHNNYAAAEALVNTVLKAEPKSIKALQLKATLQIQAWLLPQAIITCKSILKTNPTSEATSILMGRAMLLQKRYAESLAIAKKIEKQNPVNAEAYQLEADVYFWNQHPEQAEAPLKKSLAINLYNADARFSYGYAIWRRVDATQLNAMAAQWEIALAVNPCIFLHTGIGAMGIPT
ncbi:tetratricopeptide repeat protein [Mucilaginibacter antarcticus]|uniref:tetratricopeptide repeat protein n=1 Tax=Mucilaginibacter antarcticus TaxID=1855725 RepID=UPI003626BE73